MIDIMNIYPDTIIEMINSAFEMAKVPYPDIYGLNYMINKCKDAKSQDGLPEFEDVLKQLDSLLDDVGLIIGQRHQLYIPKNR